jgi:hypothetical protein
VGGYSAAYDLVASEYGWTDEQIGDLPLVRLRQITAAIQTRRYFAAREENSRTSWMTRTLASFIAGGYMTDGKSENKAATMASQLAIDEEDRLLLGATLDGSVGPKENKPGSYESFMTKLGATGGKRLG